METLSSESQDFTTNQLPAQEADRQPLEEIMPVAAGLASEMDDKERRRAQIRQHFSDLRILSSTRATVEKRRAVRAQNIRTLEVDCRNAYRKSEENQ